jgi:hypothetical protein
MACNQQSEGNVGTATGTTPKGAIVAAIRLSRETGELFCNSTGSCSGLGQSCSYTITSGSGQVIQIQGPEGQTTYQATVTTNGHCECKTTAPGT